MYGNNKNDVPNPDSHFHENQRHSHENGDLISPRFPFTRE